MNRWCRGNEGQTLGGQGDLLWAIGKRPLGLSAAGVRRNRRAARIVAYRRGDRPFILAIEPLMRTLQLRFEQIVERRDPPVATVSLATMNACFGVGSGSSSAALEGPLPALLNIPRAADLRPPSTLSGHSKFPFPDHRFYLLCVDSYIACWNGLACETHTGLFRTIPTHMLNCARNDTD